MITYEFCLELKYNIFCLLSRVIELQKQHCAIDISHLNNENNREVYWDLSRTGRLTSLYCLALAGESLSCNLVQD